MHGITKKIHHQTVQDFDRTTTVQVLLFGIVTSFLYIFNTTRLVTSVRAHTFVLHWYMAFNPDLFAVLIYDCVLLCFHVNCSHITVVNEDPTAEFFLVTD